MCDACVIDAVKAQMLSRRRFFGSAAGAATVAATALGTSVRPAHADAHGEIVDMTHTLSESFPTFSGEPGLSRSKVFDFTKDGFNLFELTLNEHTGTHIDAPLHFSEDGMSVDEIPVGNLMCPLVVIDIAARAAEDPDAQVTPMDIRDWVEVYGAIPEGACVAMHSGWAEKAASDAFRNADDAGTLHFPGFHVEATQLLLEETRAAAIAVDTLSLDHGPSTDFAAHYAWLPAGRYGIECLAGLGGVPASGATLVVGAPKIVGGTGGPARIFALT
ncbi:MAG: cyclase family protein [Pseudomonadota bacterium]